MRLRKSVSRRFGLSVVLGALGLAAISAPAWATFPGAKGRIAFASDAAGPIDIWTANPDGSGAVDVTPAVTAFDIEPDWSPDGTKIAFRGGRVATAEIYTVNANGTGLTQLTSNTDIKDYSPAWSPDGSKIAFASNRNDPHPDTCVSLAGCNIDIFVMPSTGGSPVQVTFGSGADEFEQFSPDGTRLAYNSDVSGSMAIYTVNLSTLAVTKLTADSLQAGDPDWSPDGTKIAFEDDFIFCKKPKDCNSDIYVMNADGSGLTQLTHNFGDNVEPNWSPTGDKIVFRHETLRGQNPSHIYTMNADGTGAAPLIHKDDTQFTPDWGSG